MAICDSFKKYTLYSALFGWCNMRADRGYNEGVSRVKYQ